MVGVLRPDLLGARRFRGYQRHVFTCTGQYHTFWILLVCMYVCMVITYSTVSINRVRLPILFVVSRTGKMNIPLSPFASDSLVSRDGFSRSVLYQPAHFPLSSEAEYGSYSRGSSRFQRRRPFIDLNCHTAIGSVPSLSSHANAYQWRSLPRVRRHRAISQSSG